MASIASSLAASGAASSSDSGSTSSTGSGTSGAGLANQSTFLQLLVAQLQHQNPTQPVDGTAFITQLAQFTDVEQNTATRTDLDALSLKFLGTVPSGGKVAGA